MKLKKIYKLLLAITICCFLIFSCISKSSTVFVINDSEYSLLKENDTFYFLQIKTDSTEDKWQLPYPVYNFQVGDIDADGHEDLLVGVIKTTRFDSAKAKRLFIFKNYKGLVRPLWLGSRLGQPLYDFRFIKRGGNSFIQSIEQEKSRKFLVAEYQWDSFGLAFNRYIIREVELKTAENILNSNN